MRFRRATSGDGESIARLHAESWRLHYRGAYSDVFLDGEVFRDRVMFWSERLQHSDGRAVTILAEDGCLLGFAHVIFEADPIWGALLDNIHVAPASKRHGIGSRLLSLVAGEVLEHAQHGRGLYLWVLEQNLDAQAFYAARGGSRMERAPVRPPGGMAGRLSGQPAKLRYVWPQPAVLLG